MVNQDLAQVVTAINNFIPSSGFSILPKKATETSHIFDWGVRVSYVDGGITQIGWICLADETCRASKHVRLLSSQRTSRATKHLAEQHNIKSDKVEIEWSRKKSRNDEKERLVSSTLYKENPKRLHSLLQTLLIVNNNLAFTFGESDESLLLRDIATKESLATCFNRKIVAHHIIELYVGAKLQIKHHLQSCLIPSPSLSIVVDFWTCKTKHDKFLGVRIYFIDQDWHFKSLLLATRKFDPHFSDRDESFRKCFQSWILSVLQDFDLSPDNFFGSCTDAGPDVKYMMQNQFDLKWEWCISHMTNACTKNACGMVNDITKSKNKAMSSLIRKIVKTVYQVRSNETMGNLFTALCEMLDPDSTTTQLLDYQSHRFMGLTYVIRRILDKWNVLVAWYTARTEKALRDNKPPPNEFPLKHDIEDMIGLLSLLSPISKVNKKSQGNDANQVNVLLSLYAVRMSVLNLQKPLKHYQSTKENPMWIRIPTTLTTNTRNLLHRYFQKNFFERYTSKSKLRQCPYIFEMQLLLHPSFHNLGGSFRAIVLECNAAEGKSAVASQTMYDSIKEGIFRRMRLLMTSVSEYIGESLPIFDEPMDTDDHVFSEDTMDLLEAANESMPANPRTSNDRRATVVQEELDKWVLEPQRLQKKADNTYESVLDYWKRQEYGVNFRLLPQVAKILFAIPVSSAQIERDFGIAGKMATATRSSLASYNIDMCSFLHRNRNYVDILQTPILSSEESKNCLPTNTVFQLLEEYNETVEDSFMEAFSNNLLLDEEDVAANLE